MIHCQKELFGINVGQAFCTRRFITDKQKDGLLQTFEGKIKNEINLFRYAQNVFKHTDIGMYSYDHLEPHLFPHYGIAPPLYKNGSKG